jgi:hypothetical protein
MLGAATRIHPCPFLYIRLKYENSRKFLALLDCGSEVNCMKYEVAALLGL